jgi:hypothetical protein
MTPPEVVLDRWVRTHCSKQPGCSGYIGKLDLAKVDPPSFRSLLRLVQDAMNGALALENTNASGGVMHPPFHFDYLDVKHRIRNAHAFQYEGFSFIAVTLPLVQLLWELSSRLSISQLVLNVLGLNSPNLRPDALSALLFQFQLTFLVSHEYTHHVHQHCGNDADGLPMQWNEFERDDYLGGMERQAQELDADAYAMYLVFSNFIRGAARDNSLAQVGQKGVTTIEGDEILLKCFFLAITSLFCALWSEGIDAAAAPQLGHPIAPVRIEYAIRVAQMWCDQNQSVPQSWFGAERFRELFLAAVQGVGGTTRQAWEAHISFLRSEAGSQYDQKLLQRFEVIRRRGLQAVSA